METYKFMHSQEELRWWGDYGVPPLKPNEIYFLSLSCRNKSLTEEERQYYQCGRSEMFAKQQIRHDTWEDFLKHVKRFEVRRDAYLTKSGVPFPQKSLVVYWNLTPIDVVKAMRDQISHLIEIQSALTDSALKGSKAALDDSFHKARKSFDTAQSLFARNFGTKVWVDIDVDKSDMSDSDYCEIRAFFEGEASFRVGDVMYVRTGGGIHCLIRKSALNVNPKWIGESIQGRIGAKEAVVNSNQMMPLPGTFQYGDRPVYVMNKDDFSEGDKLHR